MRRALLVAVALAALVTGVGPDPAEAQPNVVVAVAARYAPAEVVIAQGTGLTLVNLDREMTHDVLAVEGGFSSIEIGFGEMAQVVGVESLAPNTYSFYCTVHPDDMWGLLTVV